MGRKKINPVSQSVDRGHGTIPLHKLSARAVIFKLDHFVCIFLFLQVVMWYIKEVVAAVSRYNVHKLLINFMAPFTNADTWSDEQR